MALARVVGFSRVEAECAEAIGELGRATPSDSAMSPRASAA